MRVGNLAQLATALQGVARTYRLNLYGRVREVAATERLVILKTLHCQVRVVWANVAIIDRQPALFAEAQLDLARRSTGRRRPRHAPAY